MDEDRNEEVKGDEKEKCNGRKKTSDRGGKRGRRGTARKND